LINPGVLDIDAMEFPNQQATTVYVRAILEDGTLIPGITKQLLEDTPKVVIIFYAQPELDSDICINNRSDSLGT
jgi:hypothetical protein